MGRSRALTSYVAYATLAAHQASCGVAYAMHQADAGDGEAAHKWHLKQFIRLVPHGQHLTEHLASHHLDQFLFSGTPGWVVPEPEEPLRVCRCDEDPCPHEMSVHVQMPGLEDEEDDEGFPRMLASGDTRSIQKIIVDHADEEFQLALRALVGRVRDVPLEGAPLPAVVYRANTMCLKWHNRAGKMAFKEVLHASDDYYDRPWFDAVMARHKVPVRGPARRYPEERSAREQRAIKAKQHEYEEDAEDVEEDAEDDEYAEDVAVINGLYFCVMPLAGDKFPHREFVQPFLHVTWCRFFNPFPDITVKRGERADLLRCGKLLAEWDIQGVKPDISENKYMLQPDEVESIAYLQKGYFEPRAGEPYFVFTDTMWDKM